jgi:hypothetical protein
MNLPSAEKRTLLITAWVSLLIVSDLTDILLTWLGASIPPWMYWVKIAFLVVFLGLSLLWKAIRPLWQYSLILLVLFMALKLTSLLRDTAWFQENFNFAGVPFFTGYAAIMLLDILVALAVIAALCQGYALALADPFLPRCGHLHLIRTALCPIVTLSLASGWCFDIQCE